MASLLGKGSIPLKHYIAEPVFHLNAVTPRYLYEEQQRTDTVLGYNYLVTNVKTYQQVKIFVEGDPVVEPDRLSEFQEAGQRVFVEFIGAAVRHYCNKQTHAIEDSIKAEQIKIVKTNQ